MSEILLSTSTFEIKVNGQTFEFAGRGARGPAAIGGAAVWGGITGDLPNQTDLQGALDGKEDAGVAASAVSALEGSLGSAAYADTGDFATGAEGELAATAVQPAALSAYQPTSAKGQAGGYAELDGAAAVPIAQIPSAAISEHVGTFGSEAAMLSYLAPGQWVGQWVIRSDTNSAWFVVGADPSVINGWKQIPPGDYNGLINLPTLGTAAAENTSAFEAAGAVASGVAAHVSAVDPHGDRAFAIQRANHTGTQLAATISDFNSAVDARLAAVDAMAFKGVLDASGNPNYPAADAGNTYVISVDGKIGGASGPNVKAGDMALCLVDASSAGNHATVGANWALLEMNLDGAVIGPSSTTDEYFAVFDGTSGKLVKAFSGSQVRTALGLVVGTDVQAYSAVLAATTASFTTADEAKLDGIETSADVTDAVNVGGAINGVSEKTTPVDADMLSILDSAASNVLKKLSWANLKATAKTYFDTLYALVNHRTTHIVGGSSELEGLSSVQMPNATIVTESGTTRTIADSDAGKVLRCTNAAGCVVTFPDTLTAGKSFVLLQATGAGPIEWAVSGSMVATPSGADRAAHTESNGVGSIITAFVDATNSVVIGGDTV